MRGLDWHDMPALLGAHAEWARRLVAAEECLVKPFQEEIHSYHPQYSFIADPIFSIIFTYVRATVRLPGLYILHNHAARSSRYSRKRHILLSTFQQLQ